MFHVVCDAAVIFRTRLFVMFLYLQIIYELAFVIYELMELVICELAFVICDNIEMLVSFQISRNIIMQPQTCI